MKKSLRLSVLLILALLLVLVGDEEALARVGGGQTYSGGSSSGGGGGGGSGEGLFALVRLLIYLIIEVPVVGIPLTIAVIVIAIYVYKSKQGGLPGGRRRRAPRRASSNEAALEKLRAQDPNFSEPLFLDFVYNLYAKAHEARGRKELKQYDLFLSDRVIEQLGRLGGRSPLEAVRGVIIGAAQLQTITIGARQTEISVRLESNYTEVRGGQERAYYCVEIWKLARDRDVLSPEPEKARSLDCPSCGSPVERNDDGSCSYCDTPLRPGKSQWVARNVLVVNRELRGPQLLNDVPEWGTELTTVFQNGLGRRIKAFEDAHPGFSMEAFKDKNARVIFTELQKAWSERDWDRARPFVTDRLFQTYRYWIDEYKRQKLRNELSDITISSIVPAKLVSDAYYDAITVRIFASMKDATIDADTGKLRCGSLKRARSFSEYWTFIRGRGAAENTHEASSCPSCGAPLDKVTMAGVCEYCDSKITSGAFDWVLSRIEQDDSYGG